MNQELVMKMTGMKALLFGSALALAPLSLMAQSNPSAPQQNQQTPAIASSNPSPYASDNGMSGGGGVDAQMMKDKIFVRHATEGGFAEVQFGQLAAQKASDADVKKFGQKMVDEHKALDGTIDPAADELGVRLPTKMAKADQDEYDKLNTLSGTDFDKAYLLFTLRDHRKTLREFRMEESATTDPDVMDAVEAGQKVIATHLYDAYVLAKAKGVVAGKPPAPPAAPKK